MVWIFHHFRVYLEACEFDLYTDHAALKWLLGQSDLSGRLAGWVLQIQEFKYTVHHIKGTLNVVPDALSRRPYPVDHTVEDDIIDDLPDLCNIEISGLPRFPDDIFTIPKVYETHTPLSHMYHPRSGLIQLTTLLNP